jgi:uncharacterized protein YukE
MITQTEFNRALTEINQSYSKLVDRVEKLEEALREKERSAPGKGRGKRVQQAEENA